MPPLWGWIRRFAGWLDEAHLAWLALFVVAASLVLLGIPELTEFRVRATGLSLQFLGLGTAAAGVRQTKAFFAQDSVLAAAGKWLSRFPRCKRKVVMAAGTGALRLTGGPAYAEVWTPVDPSRPVQNQLDALNANTERLRGTVRTIRQDLEAQRQAQVEALRHEEAARMAVEKHASGQLAAAQTGGLHLTVVGIVWLFLGVALSTLSQEITRLLS